MNIGQLVYLQSGAAFSSLRCTILHILLTYGHYSLTHLSSISCPLALQHRPCSCWGLTTYLHGSLASTEGLFKEWRLYWLVVVLAGKGHLGMESLEMLFVLQEDTTCLLWWGCWDLALTWVSPSEQVWRDYSQARGRVCSLGRLCFPDFFWIMRNSGSALAMVPGVPTETLIPCSS